MSDEPETELADIPVIVDWQRIAEAFVRRSLRMAGKAPTPELVRLITNKVRAAFAPEPFCRHPERCAGNGYCREEIACNE